jgi:hypothetical protein
MEGVTSNQVMLLGKQLLTYIKSNSNKRKPFVMNVSVDGDVGPDLFAW